MNDTEYRAKLAEIETLMGCTPDSPEAHRLSALADEVEAYEKIHYPLHLCMCKDRPVADCPGEWEPGCDLGANPKYAVAHDPEA